MFYLIPCVCSNCSCLIKTQYRDKIRKYRDFRPAPENGARSQSRAHFSTIVTGGNPFSFSGGFHLEDDVVHMICVHFLSSLADENESCMGMGGVHEATTLLQ